MTQIYNISKFDHEHVDACGEDIRKQCVGSKSIESAARRIVRFFYENFKNSETGENSFSLVRFYITLPHKRLTDDLKEFVSNKLNKTVDDPEMRNLTLLASAGEETAWNSRKSSANHRAIPLPSGEMINHFPMISQLLKQMGVEIKHLLEPDPKMIIDVSQKTYNVFYVPKAEGSKYIPAQNEFVIPYRIKSTLGFGGMLNSGNLVVVIFFSKDRIVYDTANAFKLVSLELEMALAGFNESMIFDE